MCSPDAFRQLFTANYSGYTLPSAGPLPRPAPRNPNPLLPVNSPAPASRLSAPTLPETAPVPVQRPSPAVLPANGPVLRPRPVGVGSAPELDPAAPTPNPHPPIYTDPFANAAFDRPTDFGDDRPGPAPASRDYLPGSFSVEGGADARQDLVAYLSEITTQKNARDALAAEIESQVGERRLPWVVPGINGTSGVFERQDSFDHWYGARPRAVDGPTLDMILDAAMPVFQRTGSASHAVRQALDGFELFETNAPSGFQLGTVAVARDRIESGEYLPEGSPSRWVQQQNGGQVPVTRYGFVRHGDSVWDGGHYVQIPYPRSEYGYYMARGIRGQDTHKGSFREFLGLDP